MVKVTDYGHWMQVTHVSCGGRYHRFTAHNTTGDWRVYHESFDKFCENHESHAVAHYALDKADAEEYMQDPLKYQGYHK